jgi:hypothetical protein
MISTCGLAMTWSFIPCLGGGVLGVGISIPPPDRGIANYAMTTHGEYELKAVNEIMAGPRACGWRSPRGLAPPGPARVR